MTTSLDPGFEECESSRIRQPSQIRRKPLGNHRASLELVHVAHHHRINLDTNGVSPVSTSRFRSPIDRVTSSYFSPDSIRFSRDGSNISSDIGATRVPSVAVNHNAEVRMGRDDAATDYSNGRRGRRPETDTSTYTAASVYGACDIGAHAYPLFGMSADEAAFLTSSDLPNRAGSLTRGMGQITGEGRWKTSTGQRGPEQISLGFDGRQCSWRRVSNYLSSSLRWWFMSLLLLLSLGFGLAALLLTLHSRNQKAPERNSL